MDVKRFGPCGCGSCGDAMIAAIRHRAIQANGDDCAIYRLRVAAAAYAMAVAEYKNECIIQRANVDVMELERTSMMDVATAASCALVAAEADSEAGVESENMADMVGKDPYFEQWRLARKGKFVCDEPKPH